MSADNHAAAEACLYRFFHSDALYYRAFGWNRLPKDIGISPATANRRFRNWMKNGAWQKFWTELVKHRNGRSLTRPIESPICQIIQELQRAYAHFNSSLFANTLPVTVLILVELTKRRVGGLFRPMNPPQIAISLIQFGKGKKHVLAILLHEMVHLRNHVVGIPDAHQGYHNRHFRDAAHMFGLDCWAVGNHGYAATGFNSSGLRALKSLKLEDDIFAKRLVKPQVSQKRLLQRRRGPDSLGKSSKLTVQI